MNLSQSSNEDALSSGLEGSFRHRDDLAAGQRASTQLIVAGMHRSGTSLTASFLDRAGVVMGDQLLAADHLNQRGYFEDESFLQLQQKLFNSSCIQDEEGWADWGWTVSERFDRNLFGTIQDPAQALVKAGCDRWPLWGWKDPRTTLLLDFWDAILPNSYYVLVYRFPWDVVDSILRGRHPVFVQRPDYALRVCMFYNQHLLNFYERNRDRCLLCSTNTLVQQPSQLIRAIAQKFNLDLTQNPSCPSLSEIDQIFEASLFRTLDLDDPVVRLLQQVAPATLQMLHHLDVSADIPNAAEVWDQLSASFPSNPDPQLVDQYFQDKLSPHGIDVSGLPLLQHYKTNIEHAQFFKLFWPTYQTMKRVKQWVS
jgi:hypothetical protein